MTPAESPAQPATGRSQAAVSAESAGAGLDHAVDSRVAGFRVQGFRVSSLAVQGSGFRGLLGPELTTQSFYLKTYRP